MPPKKQIAKSLAGCNIVVAGSHRGMLQSEIQSLIVNNGGEYTSVVSNKTTHLVATPKEVKAKSQKYEAAKANAIHIVTLDWLTDSDHKKRQDETKYKIDGDDDSSATVPAPAAAPAVTTPAVTASATPTTDTAATKKTPKGKGKRKAEDELDGVVDKKIKELSTKVADKAAKRANGGIKQPPVDPAARVSIDYEVYVDHEVAWNARLNQTNIGANNNKFYLIQLLQNPKSGQYAVFSHWGRVGANGQSSTFLSSTLDGAKVEFNSKYKAKTSNNWDDRDNFVKRAGKYFLLPPDDGDTDDEDDAESSSSSAVKEEQVIPESKLHPKVQDLMGLIFNTQMMNRQMKELDYDADKMPLGKLAKATILHAYGILKKISEVMSTPNAQQRSLLQELSSEFYTAIPHNFGMRVPLVINTAPILKKKLEMLESLGEIEIAQKLIKETKQLTDAMDTNPLDQKFASLKLNTLEPLDKSSERFKLIEQYTKNTHGATHSGYDLIVDEVFDLDRQGEQQRFEDSGFDKFHNRRLLWHGSRLTNYVGILSQGLRIAPPEAPVTGYMFDKGAYFADCVSKSANYCFTNRQDNTGLMLLCEVALGDMFELQQSDYHAKTHSEAAGKHSTKGCGRSYPDEKQDVIIDNDVRVQAGTLKTEDQKQQSGYYGLQYNEYIVYNTSQIKMRYLLKMRFDYKSRY
ncbi:Poly [ADP-ribose] polymerase 2 [Podila humilis]|nr:Poly [ADP-ribose] polymerase 2 [Podila humilis]